MSWYYTLFKRCCPFPVAACAMLGTCQLTNTSKLSTLNSSLKDADLELKEQEITPEEQVTPPPPPPPPPSSGSDSGGDTPPSPSPESSDGGSSSKKEESGSGGGGKESSEEDSSFEEGSDDWDEESDLSYSFSGDQLEVTDLKNTAKNVIEDILSSHHDMGSSLHLFAKTKDDFSRAEWILEQLLKQAKSS